MSAFWSWTAPDAADLFQQWFCRETGNSPHDQMTAFPACPINPRGPGKGRLWGMKTSSAARAERRLLVQLRDVRRDAPQWGDVP